MCRLQGIKPVRQRILLIGMLHVCRQADNHGQGAQPANPWIVRYSTWICEPRERISIATMKMPNRAGAFHPSRVHSVETVPGTDELQLRYVEEDGNPKMETFDMVVLSTGTGDRTRCQELSNRLGIDLDKYHFTRDGHHFTRFPHRFRGFMPAARLPGPKISPSR